MFHSLFFYPVGTQPFYTTRGVSRAPFFYNLRPQGATATLGPKGRQT